MAPDILYQCVEVRPKYLYQGILKASLLINPYRLVERVTGR